MPRAIWSGSISFGLVNIPIRLYTATQERQIKFHFVHAKDISPILYAKICKAEEREVAYEEVARAYEYRRGDYVLMSDEDFEKANARKTHTIDILDFATEKEIDRMLYEKPYYLEPDRGADKAYALLREALKQSGKIGIAKFVLRQKENLAAVRAVGRALVLHQLRFPNELRAANDLSLPDDKPAHKKEMEMALALIRELSQPFHPEEYSDTYTDDLEKLIAQKVEGIVPTVKGQAPPPTKVHDLMAVLKASLQKEKGKKKEERKKAA